MELKKYVKFKDGTIIDLTKKECYGKYTVEDGSIISGYFYVGNKIPKDTVLEHIGFSLTATADTVWELADNNWFGDFGLDAFGLTERRDYFGIERSLFENWCVSLFAPIYENGKVIRYELVWERGENE